MVALLHHLDDHVGAVRHADYSLRPQQAFGVVDGDLHVRRAEHADDPLRPLLSALRHRGVGCWAGVRDGPRVEVRDVPGLDGVALPCGPQMLLLVRAPDQRREVGSSAPAACLGC